MLFNSPAYAAFLPIVFILYWFFFKRLQVQNSFLLVASYVFYGWWDWRFLILQVAISAIDFTTAIFIERSTAPRTRKLILSASILSNLGILGLFKYFNFFSHSLAGLLQSIGFHADAFTLEIILPVGISFYTFQNMSYTIDVYNNKLTPCKNIITYFAFVSFFPQVLAGPIERPVNLLPQFYKPRVFDSLKASEGLRQILWGLFKKIVIADNCAVYVNQIYKDYDTMSASYLLLGMVYFAFQIYGDFSGYSDIAIGTAKLFGFRLMNNFSFPYFSRDIAEFWRRWHISLSTWFRNYVYIPLGGNKVSRRRTILNVLIVFTLSGFWHGANWTFLVWGFLNGLYFIPLMLMKIHKQNDGIIAADSMLPSFREVIGVAITFAATIVAWVFFRSDTLYIALHYLGRLFDRSILTVPGSMKSCIPLIAVMIIIEWIHRKKDYGFEINYLPQVARWGAYIVVLGTIAYFSTNQDISFIYFQF